jgi:hypothetical protein
LKQQWLNLEINKVLARNPPLLSATVAARSLWGMARKIWYVQADQILALVLGCELITFPGHHGSFT